MIFEPESLGFGSERYSQSTTRGYRCDCKKENELYDIIKSHYNINKAFWTIPQLRELIIFGIHQKHDETAISKKMQYIFYKLYISQTTNRDFIEIKLIFRRR